MNIKGLALKNYPMYWSKERLKYLVSIKRITEEEYKEVTGEEYKK